MWFSQKTEGIILSVSPWKEADKRYVALSPSLGKIEFIGRGAQKSCAKLSAHLEPFACTQLELVVGKRQTTIIGVERLEIFWAIGSSLERRMLAHAACTLIEKTVHYEQKDAQLYGELKEFLLFLERAPDFSSPRGAFLLGGFLLRLLVLLGYQMELRNCVACQEDIQPLAFRWHDARGGLVCTSCVLKGTQEWGTARHIDEEIVTLLRFARSAQYDDFLKMGVQSAHLTHFSSCIHDVLRCHIPGYTERPYWEMVLI